MLVLANPLASVWRILGSAGLKCLRMGASVKANFNFRNAGSASPVHSHLTCLDFLQFCAFCSRSDISVITIAYFQMNHWYKFVNPRSTWTSRPNSRFDQSTIIDMRSDSMAIPSGLMTYPRKPTSETPKLHCLALPWRPNSRSRSGTFRTCSSCSSTLVQ